MPNTWRKPRSRMRSGVAVSALATAAVTFVAGTVAVISNASAAPHTDAENRSVLTSPNRAPAINDLARTPYMGSNTYYGLTFRTSGTCFGPPLLVTQFGVV